LNCDSAINLGLDDGGWLAGFERGAELIGLDDAERQAGRGRWKAYERAGHSISHYPQSGA
jgi:DNA polymerase-3 subunit chi